MLCVKGKLFPGQGTMPLAKHLPLPQFTCLLPALRLPHPYQIHHRAAPSPSCDKDPKSQKYSCFPAAKAALSTNPEIIPN